MSCFNFISWFLILLINLKSSNNTLVSRFKNRNEYVPSNEKLLLPEDIDDALYEELLLEVPELRGQFRRNNISADEYSMLPYLKSHNPAYETGHEDEEFDMETNYQEDYPTRAEYDSDTQASTYNSSDMGIMPFLKRRTTTPESFTSLESLTQMNDSWVDGRRRGWWPVQNYYNKKRMATCYWCGIHGGNKRNLPESSICYDAFESPDWRARTMARFFRARCFKDYWFHEHIDGYRFSEWTYYRWDRGLVRAKYGLYYGGCFKRFTDVGKIYTQRGCRSRWPIHSAQFPSHRYKRLELLIRKKKDYCIVSPHASLTPFSRAISLYVRYHVCVCSKKYCNAAQMLNFNFTLSLILLTLLY